MSAVTSKDGTRIAYSKQGSGPALVLVDGAMCYRGFGPMPSMAKALASRFTVYTYDRRGRGESSDNTSYAVQKEIDDLAAIIAEAGGAAAVFGASSGAALALEAARTDIGIRKLAMYEAPFIVDDSRDPVTDDYHRRLKDNVAAGRNGDAIAQFMKVVGVPGIFILMMKLMPMWKKMKAIAPTLLYDTAIVIDYERGRPLPRDRWSSVKVPAWVGDGGKSPAWMRNAMKQLASVVPGAQYRTLPGQTHMVKAEALTPELITFFGGEAA